MKLKVKRLREEARVPFYAKSGDAGFDLFSTFDCELNPGERKLVGTGLAF
mgnify:FL=1